jgi:hypothetical protein
MELSGQIAAGISLQLPSARRWAAQDGAIQAGTPSDGRSCRPVVCARQSNVRDQVGIEGTRGETTVRPVKSPALPTQVRILSLPH